MKKARMPRKKLTYFYRLRFVWPLAAAFSLLIYPLTSKTKPTKGKEVFHQYCGSCHSAGDWIAGAPQPALNLVFPQSPAIPKNKKKAWYEAGLKKWGKQKLKLPRKVTHPLVKLKPPEMKKLGDFFLTPGTEPPGFLRVCFSCHKLDDQNDARGLSRLIPRYESVSLDPNRWQTLPRDRLMRFLNLSRHKTIYLEGKIRHFKLPKNSRKALAVFFARKNAGLSKN